MFPLQMTLLPGATLLLQVFEPRFVALLEDVLAGDREFGVVMIERGSEVGGDDVRSNIGTIAQVLASHALRNGRWALLAAGIRRIRVERWLEDDPYPRAEVCDWPDEPESAAPQNLAQLEELPWLVTRARQLAARLAGLAEPEPLELAAAARYLTAGSFAYAAASCAPLGAFDRFTVLSAATASERVSLVRRLVSDQIELLEARIGPDRG